LSFADIALVILLILGAFKGYKDGFLMELFSLLGIILGVLGGFKLMGMALIYLSDEFNIDENVLPYIAFSIVFIVIVVLVTLTGRAIKASIDKTFLGKVDETLGGVLGLLKTAFLLSVAIWLLQSLHYNFPEHWTANSKVFPRVAKIAPAITHWVGQFVPFFHDIF
jgi:membrane protein required for colicin V production